MVRSLEEVCIVSGLYLFQSKESTSAPGWACIDNVAVMVRINLEEGSRDGKRTIRLTDIPKFES
jgi:hypothetical protein